MTVLIEAETYEETIDRVKEALRALYWKNPPIPNTQDRGKIGYFFHTLMNVITEGVRRNAQFAAKTILFGFPSIILFYEWGNIITAT